MLNDIWVLLLGLLACACEIPIIYRIYKKCYGKESITITGKVVGFFSGDGLIKTYTPVIEIEYEGRNNRIIAKDNMSLKPKYLVNDRLEVYYNRSFKKVPILIKKDYGSLFDSILILGLALGLIFVVIINGLNGGDSYTRIRPWN